MHNNGSISSRTMALEEKDNLQSSPVTAMAPGALWQAERGAPGTVCRAEPHCQRKGAHWIGGRGTVGRPDQQPCYPGGNYIGRERKKKKILLNFSNSCNYLDLLITSLSLSERNGNKPGFDAGYSHGCCVSALICSHFLWHIFFVVLSKNW